MRVYLASSWKNDRQPWLLDVLRAAGHDVYDFRNPAPGVQGFGWRTIISTPRPWPLHVCRTVLEHQIAEEAFGHDMRALATAEAVVLLLPSGNDAHMEAAFAAGRGKPVAVYCDRDVQVEPSLMWKLLGHTSVLCDDANDVCALLAEWGML